MKQIAAVLIVLSGICFLTTSSFHSYKIVPVAKTWSDAKIYCRENYIDLAIVRNQQDLAELNRVTGMLSHISLWIGLLPDPHLWRWSLEDPDYYGEGEADLRLWSPGQPNFGYGEHRACVLMMHNGLWGENFCSITIPFLCYDQSQSDFIFVSQSLNWDDARKYCMEHHTDLASVRNQVENQQMFMKSSGVRWIGLYRDSWQWSDGSPASVTNWSPESPTTQYTDACGSTKFGKWTNAACEDKKFFACSADMQQIRVVKMVLTTSGSPVDMDELQKAILEKLEQRVGKLSTSEDFKLRWVKQPDGKIFGSV